MNRRLALKALACLGVAAADVSGQTRVARVGVLRPGTAKESASIQREPFERGLRELGLIPGQNVVIDYRHAEGDASRLPRLAVALVQSKVDVIVSAGLPAIHAARAATSSIPIVMAAGGGDPVAEGLVKDFSRPGGNITGIALIAFHLDPKRLELLKEVSPSIRRVAVLATPENEPHGYKARLEELRGAAQALNVGIEVFEVKQAPDLGRHFSAIAKQGFDALMVRADPRLMDPNRRQIVAEASRLRLPAVYFWRFYVEAGGLVSYGESIPWFHHRSANYVSRILKGANPADLAVERPTQFDLTLNVKAAKALGLEIPKSILFRADEIIE